MKIRIDTHHHAVPPFYVEAMNEAGVRKVSTLAFPKWSPKQSLKMMDSVGIERAMLSLSTPGVEPALDPNGLARRVNDYLATVRSRRPDRFGAFGVIPLGDSEAAIAEAVYVLDELEFEGIGLLSNGGGTYLDSPRFDRMFREIDRRAATVFIHATDPVDSRYEGLVVGFYGWFIDTSRTALQMEAAGVFERYSNITFILGHGGGALPVIGDIVSKRLRIYCDTAKVAEPAPLESIRSTFGASRITFGSDYPWARKARYWKSQIEKTWSENEEVLEAVFGQNAACLIDAHIIEENR